MVAVATAPFRPTTPPPTGSGPSRPALRVLEGGRAPGRRATSARYLRRRLIVLGLVVLVVVGVARLATAAVAGPTPPGPAVATSAAGPAAVHVVQPGDTLWSIAGAIAPEADVRLVVDQLVALNGAAPLAVGQRLALPTP